MMRNRWIWRASIPRLMAACALFFSVDSGVIEDAEACSIALDGPRCFQPLDDTAVSGKPDRLVLNDVEAERNRYSSSGCMSETSCSDVTYDRVEFRMEELDYDEDELEQLGMRLNVRGDGDAVDAFLDALAFAESDACTSQAIQLGNGSGMLSRTDDGEVVIDFTISHLDLSTSDDLEVSGALVDGDGNVGEYSDWVDVRRTYRSL